MFEEDFEAEIVCIGSNAYCFVWLLIVGDDGLAGGGFAINTDENVADNIGPERAAAP